MFESAVVESRKSAGKKSTIVVSTAIHVLVVGLLLIAPLLVTEVLPSTGFGDGVLLLPGGGGESGGGAPPPLPLSRGSQSAQSASTATELVATVQPSFDVPEFERPTDPELAVDNPTIPIPVASPVDVPTSLRKIADLGDPLGVLVGGDPTGKNGGDSRGRPNGTLGSNGTDGGVGIGRGQGPGGPGSCVGVCGGGIGPGGGGGGGISIGLLPPARRLDSGPVVAPTQLVSRAPVLMPALPVVPIQPAAVAPPPPPKPTVMRGDDLAANCRSCPKPEYPDLARIAKISDIVVLSAVVGKDGLVKEVKVIRGHTLLQQAALNAVRKWEYNVQKLNGAPVEVTATISIQFVFR